MGAQLKYNLTFDNLWEVEDTVVCMLDNNFSVVPMLDPTAPEGAVLFPFIVQLHAFAAYDMFDGYQERLLSGGKLGRRKRWNRG